MGETSQQGKPSQIPAVAAQIKARKETKTSPSRRIRRLLPKSHLNNSNDISTSAAFAQKKRQKRKKASLLHEVCLFNPESIITTGDGPTPEKFFLCDKCPSTEELVKCRRFEDLSRHYSRSHHLRILKNASVFCREENCSFKVRPFFNFIHCKSKINRLFDCLVLESRRFEKALKLDSWIRNGIPDAHVCIDGRICSVEIV